MLELAVEQFDEYCERVGFSLLAEPINAISNIGFIVAAWAAWTLAKRTGTLPTGIKVLIGLAGSTAIGSMLWHTLANTWSLYLDVIPIALFMVGVLWLYVRNVMGKDTKFAALSVAAFFLSALLVRPIGDDVHGAPSYFPGLLLILVLGTYHAIQQKPSRFTLLAAAGTYFTALFFRTIDNELCHYMTIGTHFIWHCLIALVTYLVMRGLILSLPPRPTEDGSIVKESVSSTVSERSAALVVNATSRPAYRVEQRGIRFAIVGADGEPISPVRYRSAGAAEAAIGRLA